jgi:hypothetical protein
MVWLLFLFFFVFGRVFAQRIYFYELICDYIKYVHNQKINQEKQVLIKVNKTKFMVWLLCHQQTDGQPDGLNTQN